MSGGWQALATLNKISDPYVIRIGQTLLLPTTSTQFEAPICASGTAFRMAAAHSL